MSKDKMIIGYDTEGENKYLQQKSIKLKIASDMLKYCREYITIQNEQTFVTDAENSFKTLFNEQYREAYADMNIIYEKQLELVGFSLNKLRAFVSYFNGIAIDIYSKEKRDFNKYLHGADKIKVYKQRQKFLTALDEYLDTGGTYQAFKFQQAFSGQFFYDYNIQKCTPILN